MRNTTHVTNCGEIALEVYKMLFVNDYMNYSFDENDMLIIVNRMRNRQVKVYDMELKLNRIE